MPVVTMQSLFHFLIQAFDGLGVTIPNERLERMAVTVYTAMSNPSRHYHNLDHVFNFIETNDPILYLAAVFHDLVYYQVDNGIPPELQNDIRPYLRRVQNRFCLPEHPPSDDREGCLMELFGLRPGQQMGFNTGLNEFLSALVAVKNLGGLIQDQDLFDVVLCIEATIPFRGNDEKGRSHFEVMAERLSVMARHYAFLGTQERIDTALKRAVLFANRDVETFSMEDAAKFIDITFRLLPESNAALRNNGVFTIRDYRIGLQKMQQFLGALNPDHVFNQYKDTPPPSQFVKMVSQTRRNVSIALQYLEIKLLALALLESLAEATGGDAPLSLFVGDLLRPGSEDRRMIEYLPEILQSEHKTQNSVMFRLLSGGLRELGFDLPQSPISLIIYTGLSEEERKRLFAMAQDFFDGIVRPEEFLHMVPRPVLEPVAKALAEMVVTRRERLLHYAHFG